MAEKQDLLIVLITNSVYGDSNYEQKIWEGATKAALSEGATLCTIAGGQIIKQVDGSNHIPFLFDLAARSQADGFIINGGTIQVGVSHEEYPEIFKAILDRPLISIAHEVKGAMFASVDNMAGMKAMITHLIDNFGAKRIVYISGPYTNSEALDRLRAYKETLQDHNIPVDESLIFEGSWTAPSGKDAVNRLIEKGIKFDALAAANDLMAVDALEALQQRGFNVPKDLPVSGFDDADVARFSTPKLSTVFQPISDLSESAVRLLIKSIRHGTAQQREMVPARMVLRASAPSTHEQVSKQAGGAQKNSENDELAQLVRYLRDTAAQFVDLPFLREISEAMQQSLQSGNDGVSAVISKNLRNANGAQIDRLEIFSTKIRLFRDDHLQSISSWKKTSNILHELNQGINEFRLNDTFHRSKESEALTNSLITINRTLNEVGSLESLEAGIERAFPLCGIQTCHIVLFDGDKGAAGQAHTIASIIDGKGQSALRDGSRFDASQIIKGGLHNAGGKEWIVCQLAFEEQKLGFIVYQRSQASPFVYEALSNQVASLLHSILLIDQIEKAEAMAAERANKISELVRPMLATIEASGALARDQGSTMAKLAVANTETAHRLAESEKHVAEMGDDLKKIISLTTTIDELSETINVIAINAAIAAARAGADGKVFGVISSEIRKLSIQTKTSTGEISNYLAELGKNSSSFIESNTQTREVFSHLESEIQSLLTSLENIQASMSDLTDRAQLVLATMT